MFSYKFKIYLTLILALFVMSGCQNSKKIKPHYQKANKKAYKAVPAAYRYPTRVVVKRGVKSNVYDPYARRGIYTPKVSRSLRELDRDSQSVRPTLVYSKRANFVNYGVNSIDISPYREKMLSYINSLRGQYNLNWAYSLENAASAHAGDMATNNFLGHIGSGRATDLARKSNGRGSNFYERIMRFGYPIRGGLIAGEVVTYTKDNIVGNKDVYFHFIHAMDNFQKSARHRAILLNPRFNNIGISAYRGYNKIYWVIEFAQS
jgi:uncharacterized protein YkwD